VYDALHPTMDGDGYEDMITEGHNTGRFELGAPGRLVSDNALDHVQGHICVIIADVKMGADAALDVAVEAFHQREGGQ